MLRTLCISVYTFTAAGWSSFLLWTTNLIPSRKTKWPFSICAAHPILFKFKPASMPFKWPTTKFCKELNFVVIHVAILHSLRLFFFVCMFIFSFQFMVYSSSRIVHDSSLKILNCCARLWTTLHRFGEPSGRRKTKLRSFLQTSSDRKQLWADLKRTVGSLIRGNGR